MAKRILYITTRLPSITLTFVYREIEVLLKSGYEIKTVSMGRPHKNQISEEALWVYQSTLYLDQVSLIRKVIAQLRVLHSKPRKWFYLLWLALREREIVGFKDRIRILYHFLEAGYLFTQLKDNYLDHIHAHFLSGPASIALFLSNYLNIPYSFTMHGRSIFIDHIMLKTKLIECKKGITISEYNKKYLISKYGEQIADKIEIIHCGIDLKVFKPGNHTKPQPPIIISVGQLIEIKGLRYLVEACRILKESGLEFVCRIVGGGKEMALLREMVDKYRLSKVVILLGRQPQGIVKQLLPNASIFVLPSIITESGGREGIPVALMEAMAMRLPVVSTMTVGIPELIEHGREGLLVEQKNPDQLASALKFLLVHSKTRAEMGARGRKKVTQQFNIDHIPKLFGAIFN